MADFLFTQFSQQNLRSGTDVVQTTGRSALGVAPGTYVADSLATAALFAAHPRFVGQSSNGRYFRALPINGELPVELGGATGNGAANDQLAIQATVSYAEAVGARVIVFSASEYRLFCPVRTSEPAAPMLEHFYDGFPIVVSRPLIFKSQRQGGSRLVFRHSDGSDRAANYQLVTSPTTGQPTVWRGGGIFLKCPEIEPSNFADRPAVTLVDMVLDGGIPRSNYFVWPARASDGDGWDITDKGLWVEGDRYSGDLTLIRSTITGFRGELIYQAGLGNGGLTIRDSVLSETNGNLIQAGGTGLDIDGLTGMRAFQAFEGWSGRHGRIVNTVFDGCIQTGSLAGGRFSSGPFNNIPTRMPDGEMPWLHLDVEFRDCGKIKLGSWSRGRVRLTDSFLQFDGSQTFAEGIHDVDLEVQATADQITGITPVVLVGSDLAGKMSLSDIRIRLACWRSDDARANGRVHTQPVSYIGSIGPNVVIEQCTGEALRNSGPAGNPLTDVTDHLPCFRNNRWTRTTIDWAGTLQDVSVTPQIVPRADSMAVTAPSAGTWPITLPVTGIGNSHELVIRNIAAAGRHVSIAASGAGVSLAARRIIVPGSRIALRFDAEAGQWIETAGPGPLRNSATPSIAAIPAGATSPEIQISCPGAIVGMIASAVPSGEPGADFEVCGIRAVTDAVRFRVRNLGSVSAVPPVMTWTVTAA